VEPDEEEAVTPAVSSRGELRRALTAVVSLIGLVGYVYSIGWLVTGVQEAWSVGAQEATSRDAGHGASK
jgi:hypothetical protein